MTEKPFSIEPDEEFSQPVERLGATASDAAHLNAFGRPKADDLQTVSAAERSGWMQATPMGAQRVEPTPTAYNPGSGSILSTTTSTPRVLDYGVERQENEVPRDDVVDLPPFSYDLGDGVDGHGLTPQEAHGHHVSQPDMAEGDREPFNFTDGESPRNPDGDPDGSAHQDELEEPEMQEAEYQQGGGIKDFLLRHNSLLLYGGCGLVGLIFVYFTVFGSGGRHQPQKEGVSVAAAVQQAELSRHASVSPDQPSSLNTFPATGFVPGAGQPQGGDNAPPVIFNSKSAVQAAPPPAQSAQIQTAHPVQTAGLPVPQQAAQSAAGQTDTSSPVSSPNAAQAVASPDMPSNQPVQAAPTLPQTQTPLPADIQAPPAALPPAPIAETPPAQEAAVAPVDATKLAAVTTQLQQISASVTSLNSKMSDNQSSMSATISQMDDKISNLQSIVLQLEMKVAIAGAKPDQTVPVAAPAAAPVTSQPSAAPTVPAVSAQAAASAAPPQNNMGKVASLPVLNGYSLQGYSKGAVVVGTPMGEVTVKINDTVPGAGTAKGLYRFDPSNGQYGIELVTDQGVIRPTGKSPY